MTALLKTPSPRVDLAAPETAAAALRTFFRLAEAWSLSVAEQTTLLGIARTTLYQWKQGRVAPLERHMLERLSHLFGIYAALHILFPVASRADAWLRKPNAAPLFGGRSALDRMLGGQVADLFVVRQYLDAQRGGKGLSRLRPAMAIDPKSVPLVRVSWRPSYRLIPSRFPTVGLFDAIADPADLDAVFAIEALANPRLRDELGELQLVPPDERVSGPGTTPVMAAFTHLNPEGSRFSDGGYGVYYAAHSLQTALAEVSFHRAAFLRRTAEPAIDLDMRLITASVEADLHDLGGAMLPGTASPRFAAALDPDDYGPPQRLGRALREAGSWGVRYPSVREQGGECVGIFRPRALRHARAAAHIALHWDGRRITHWFEKKQPNELDP